MKLRLAGGIDLHKETWPCSNLLLVLTRAIGDTKGADIRTNMLSEPISKFLFCMPTICNPTKSSLSIIAVSIMVSYRY